MPNPLERHPSPPRTGDAQDRNAGVRRRIATRRAFGAAGAVFLAGTLFVLSSRTTFDRDGRFDLPGGFFGNFAHFVYFAALAASATVAIDRGAALFPAARGPRLIAFQLAAFYGLFDEVHQYLTPGRTCSVFDVLVDALGAAFPALVRTSPRPDGRRRPDVSRSAGAVVAVVIGATLAYLASKSRPDMDLRLERLLDRLFH